MLIPVLLEPDYQSSIWAKQTLDGIEREAARKKYEVRMLSGDYRQIDLDEAFRGGERMAVILGTSLSWVPDALDYFTRQGVASILISFNPAESKAARGVVRMDYAAAMHTILSYLADCGHTRAALYGFNPNSSADLVKRDYFARWNARYQHAGQPNEFLNLASLEECYKKFIGYARRFDAVVCANDIVAASLLTRLKADSIRVPEDMYLVSFGNSALARGIRPALTSVSFDHGELGRRAVNLYAFLYRQEASADVSVRVRGVMTVRESTALSPILRPDGAPALSPTRGDDVNFYSDPEADRLLRVEALLSNCTDADRAMLSGLLAGESHEKMAESLYLSVSALRYRLKRIMTTAGCDTRAEFDDFLALCGSLGLF